MDERPTPDQVRLWLKRLAAMIGKSHFHTDEEWGELVDLYAPGLCERFEASAFTGRSLEGIAAQCLYFPGYKALLDMLSTWLHERRQSVLAVEDADLAALAPEQRHWVRCWHEGLPGSSHRELAHRASMIRSHAPEAWDHLVRRDPGLLAHAPAAFALPDEGACWASEETVRRSVALLGEESFPQAPTALLRAALERHAPHYLPLLEAALGCREAERGVGCLSIAAQVVALAGPQEPPLRPSAACLSVEHLARSRTARGIVPLGAAGTLPPEPARASGAPLDGMKNRSAFKRSRMRYMLDSTRKMYLTKHR